MPTPFEIRKADSLDLASKMVEDETYARTQVVIDRLRDDGLFESVPYNPALPSSGGVLIGFMRLTHELNEAYEEGREHPEIDHVENMAAGLLSSYIGAGDTNTDRDLEVGFLYGMAELTLALTGIGADESYSDRREQIARDIDDLAFGTYAAPYRVITRIDDI